MARPKLPGYDCIEGPYRGNFGEVFILKRERPEDIVAVKVPYHYLSPDLVVEEAERQMSVTSPYVVQIRLVPNLDGRQCIVMEYCPKSLAAYLQERFEQVGTHIPYAEGRKILWEILRGIDDAHKAGLIHGDLKPANILMSQVGTPKIADFGAARRLHDRYPSIYGSLDWMAPEVQDRRRQTTKESDYFSFGILAYLILTGEHPYFCEDRSCLRSEADNIRNPKCRPTKLKDLRSDVPRDVAREVVRLLSRTKPPRAKAFFNLEVLLSPGGLPPPPKAVSPTPPPPAARPPLLTPGLEQRMSDAYNLAQQQFFREFNSDAALSTLNAFLREFDWEQFRGTEVASLADLWSFAAYLHNSGGNYSKADAAATNGLQVDPNHVNSLHTRGYARIQLGRDKDAKEDLERALESTQNRRKRSQINRLLGAIRGRVSPQ